MAWLSFLLGIVAFAGGGGSSSGGGGGGSYSGGSSYYSSSSDGSGSSVGTIISIVFWAVLIVAFLIFSLRTRSLAKKSLAAKTKSALAEAERAATTDASWNPEVIEQRAKDVFIQYQKDWSDFNSDAMKTYMTTNYYHKNLLMMGALKQIKRQNKVTLKTEPDVTIEIVHDETGSEHDWFRADIQVTGIDELLDTELHASLYKQETVDEELYKFTKNGDQWVLDDIDQPTAAPDQFDKAIQDFATAEGYFYSLDWGRLLLPSRGQLFAGGSFAVSDINNHVIGLLDDVIIQLYTYNENPETSTRDYVIAQAVVPKRYGDIIVRHRKGVLNRAPKGLKQVRTEWDDFNKKYDVFASDTEQATSFELLNPAYMEKLEALPFEVNIEVVDNIVYLYASYQQGNERERDDKGYYQKLLVVLKAAYKEMYR